LTFLPPEAAGFLRRRERLAAEDFSDEQRTIGFGGLRKIQHISAGACQPFMRQQLTP
jgi:hypothetical protein